MNRNFLYFCKYIWKDSRNYSLLLNSLNFILKLTLIINQKNMLDQVLQMLRCCLTFSYDFSLNFYIIFLGSDLLKISNSLKF